MNVVSRLKSIMGEWCEADISELRRLQQEEFSKNNLYKQGWDIAMKELCEKRKNLNLKSVQQMHYPDEYHIALICYTLEKPDVYGEFNRQTRNVKEREDLDRYHYKTFFIFLLKSIKEMRGCPTQPPHMLYRGCSVKFSNATPGQYIIFQQYTSTSSSETVAVEFAGEGTLFEIHGCVRNVVGMDHHTVFPKENEFVIWPFEVFEIQRVITELNITRIILQALSSPRSSILKCSKG